LAPGAPYRRARDSPHGTTSDPRFSLIYSPGLGAREYQMDYETKPFTKPEQGTLPPQRRPNTQAMTPRIKMFVSDWSTDELGNKARVIKARD
jgi:hypothetical protein